MFAFAIWDQQEQKLFAARDRFGEKPLYYYADDQQFLFASEFKALWAAGVPKQWNHMMLLNFLANGHTQNAIDGSLTFYKYIFAVPPGHYATYRLRNRELYVTIYWDLDKQHSSTPTETAAAEQLQQLLQTSIERRLRSDVATGTSLSGGLDSSSIAAIIHSINPSANYLAFTSSFPGFEKDELTYAADVCRKFQLHHQVVTPTLQGFLADFDALAYYQEQPFNSSSVYAQYKVMELAKQHKVTVLLDGQGADEVLAGYNKYVHWYLQEQLAKFKFGFAVQERIKLQQNKIPFPWGFGNYMAALFPMIANAQLEEVERKRILMHPHLNKDYSHAYYDKMYSIYKPPVSKLNDILYFNTMQQGLGELLHYADRNSMAHGREVRLPFLSHELVEFVFSLPSHYKIRNGFPKWLLRIAMQDRLPNAIVWRTEKIGYEPPQQSWMEQSDLQERIHESRKRLTAAGILYPMDEIPIQAKSAYAPNNFDWRYLTAAQYF
jgi:asparagine synthase (glutamine-hydrolysing)